MATNEQDLPTDGGHGVSGSTMPHQHPHGHDGLRAAPTMVTDPVCGMSVNPSTAKHVAEHEVAVVSAPFCQTFQAHLHPEFPTCNIARIGRFTSP